MLWKERGGSEAFNTVINFKYIAIMFVLQVSIHSEYSIPEPGLSGKIIIRGNTQGTYVGLLGVDEAVYALSKKDILTKANVSKLLFIYLLMIMYACDRQRV